MGLKLSSLIGWMKSIFARGRSWRSRRPLMHDWKRFVPETLLMCGLLLAADQILFAHDRFATLRFSPFWVPVLLAACQYGLLGGAFAATTATLFLYAGAMPAQAAHQDYYDYASMLAEQPAAWFAVAIGLGALRTLHLHKDAKSQRNLAESEERLGATATGLSRAISEIANLERRIAGDTGTVNRLLRGVAAVDPSTTETLRASLAPLISDALSASTFKFYLRTFYGLEHILTVDEEGAAQGEAAPILASTFEALAARPQTVTRADANSGQILPAGALMLAPIVGTGGVLRGALVIDRVRAPAHAIPSIAQRANHLGRVIGGLLEWSERRDTAVPETDHRTPAAGEA